MSNTNLVNHYDNKYRGTLEDKIQEIKVTSVPKNRFEMTVACGVKNSGGRYLEIGAGSGGTLYTLLNYYDELVATELSPVRTQVLNKIFGDSKTEDKIRIICNNIETDSLEYPDKYFNTIVMNAVIEHLFDPIAVINKLYRLTSDGGRLIIGTPNIAKYTRRIKLLLGYFPSTASTAEGLICYDEHTPTDLYDEGHLHYFTYRSLGKILIERAGFKKIEFLGFGIPVLSKIWPELFSDDVFIIAYK